MAYRDDVFIQLFIPLRLVEKEHIRLVKPRLTDRERVSFSCVLINVDICGKWNVLSWLGQAVICF